MIDPAKTRDIIRQWDNREKGVSQHGTKLAKQIMEITSSWESFRAGQATLSEQLIAYQVHKYLMSSDTHRQKVAMRNLTIYKIVSCYDMSINRACGLVAGAYPYSLGKGSVIAGYRSWKRDPENIKRALNYYENEHCHYLWEALGEGG